VPKNLVTARLFEEIAWRLDERGIKGWEEVDGGGGRDAAAAGDEQLGSCAAGKVTYTTKHQALSTKH
jgi:hypothetical protein